MMNSFEKWENCKYSLVSRMDKDGYPVEYLCARAESLMGGEIRCCDISGKKVFAAVLIFGGNPRENRKIRKALSKSCKRCRYFKKRE